MPSSVIKHFSCNEKSQTLKIKFVTGLVYLYKNVPPKTVKMLVASGSKGRFFNYYIKDKFPFQKLAK